MNKFYDLVKYKNGLSDDMLYKSISLFSGGRHKWREYINNKISKLHNLKEENPAFAKKLDNFINKYQTIIDSEQKIIDQNILNNNLIRNNINQLLVDFKNNNRNNLNGITSEIFRSFKKIKFEKVFSQTNFSDLNQFESFIQMFNIQTNEHITKYCTIVQLLNAQTNEYATKCRAINRSYIDIDSLEKNIIDSLKNEINRIESIIDSLAQELFFNIDYQTIFTEGNLTGPSQEIALCPINQEIVISKISHYVDWRYPTLIINPISKKYIDAVVAGEPLYIASYNMYMIKDIIKDYSDLYQSRLRLYHIKKRKISKLPQGQFGFVLCWDVFNYLSLDKIEQYIEEVWVLLRPGGTFMFNYNNCDLTSSAQLTVSNKSSYANYRYLAEFITKIGFNIISAEDRENHGGNISWIEIQRPGELTTIKIASPLARIAIK